jgi:hypothetical protein
LFNKNIVLSEWSDDQKSCVFSSFLKKSELISAVWLAGWLVGWLGALDLRTGKR